MRLDELRENLDEFSDMGAPQEYAVVVIRGSRTFGIDRLEFDPDGNTVRIYLEE